MCFLFDHIPKYNDNSNNWAVISEMEKSTFLRIHFVNGCQIFKDSEIFVIMI